MHLESGISVVSTAARAPRESKRSTSSREKHFEEDAIAVADLSLSLSPNWIGLKVEERADEEAETTDNRIKASPKRAFYRTFRLTRPGRNLKPWFG